MYEKIAMTTAACISLIYINLLKNLICQLILHKMSMSASFIWDDKCDIKSFLYFAVFSRCTNVFRDLHIVR